jgi:RNA 3'-terminal phosphate cyclase (ATP)
MARGIITLHGATLEGGGQLLRIAAGLSALTGNAIKITDIRGNRAGGGGLKLQHLKAVEWLAKASAARIEGAEKGSRVLEFCPEDLVCGLK